MTSHSTHPAITRLRSNPEMRPLVASHRGNSRHFPENTLAAFRSASRLGVSIQEFDVRELACGELVCIHDETFDRTTNASALLGPGTLVAETDLATARTLDAGTWHGTGIRGEQVATLAEALDVMLPSCVALIEHKAGSANRYVEFLRANNFTDQVILQSFDWQFLMQVHRLAPEIAIGALGPNKLFATPTASAIEQMKTFDAAIVHWRARDLTEADINRSQAAGLLVCSYTTDDAPGWLRGKAMGIDAMCTNDPKAMRAALEVSR